MIRHHGREVDYDWSSESSSAIQWAAFYSDCEHEIKEVTEAIASPSLTTSSSLSR